MILESEPSEGQKQRDQTESAFGRYHIRDVIGEGAMAQVFEAYDPATDRRIALKVLKPHLRSDNALVNRFMNEAKAAGGLSHTHIVACHDVDIEDGVPYITMELIEGPSLERLLAEESSMDLEATVEHLCQIAHALDHAHQAGRIHRDIKPSNILLTSDLKTVKIADFGVARIEQTDLTAVTSLGEFIGTPRYTSPEQLNGGVIDSRSDLFSFGVVAYEMLTRRKAFDATTLPSLSVQITNDTPVPIRSIRPDLSPDLAATVEKLLAKAPDARWQTGADFVRALQRPPTREAYVSNRSWRGWFMGGIALAVSLVAVVLVISTIDRPYELAQEVEQAMPLPSATVDPGAGLDIEPAAPPLPAAALLPAALPFKASLPPNWPADWQDSWLRLAAEGVAGDCFWLDYDGNGDQPGIKGITDGVAVREQTLAHFLTIRGGEGATIDLVPSDSAACFLARALNEYALPAPQRMIELSPPKYQLYEGDEFEISIAPPRDAGYVALFHVDTEGMVNQLYELDARSWDGTKDNGRIVVTSHFNGQRWRVFPPFGTETLFLLATNAGQGPSATEPEELTVFLDRLSSSLAMHEDAWHLASLLRIETTERPVAAD